MKTFFHGIRASRPCAPGRAGIAALAVLLAGAALGGACKLLDLYTVYLGDIFSQISVWILLCSALCLYSPNPLQAGVRVFAFCIGMLAAYYAVAEGTGSVYSMTFVQGWLAVCCAAPWLAGLVWYAGGRGWFARALGAGVLLAALGLEILLFDKLRVWDILLDAVLGILLFQRPGSSREKKAGE